MDHKEDHKVALAGQEGRVVRVAPVATCMDVEVLMESDLVVLLVDQELLELDPELVEVLNRSTFLNTTRTRVEEEEAVVAAAEEEDMETVATTEITEEYGVIITNKM